MVAFTLSYGQNSYWEMFSHNLENILSVFKMIFSAAVSCVLMIPNRLCVTVSEKTSFSIENRIWDNGGFLLNFFRWIQWNWCQVLKMSLRRVGSIYVPKIRTWKNLRRKNVHNFILHRPMYFATLICSFLKLHCYRKDDYINNNNCQW